MATPKVLERPLTVAELIENLDGTAWVDVVVAVDFNEAISHDIEGWLAYLDELILPPDDDPGRERYEINPCLSSQSYEVVGVLDGKVLLSVTAEVDVADSEAGEESEHEEDDDGDPP